MPVSKTPEKSETTTEKSDLSLVGKTNLALAVKVNLCGQSRGLKHQTEGVSKWHTADVSWFTLQRIPLGKFCSMDLK